MTTVPFANVGDPVRSVDDFRRWLMRAPATTVTVEEWSLIYSPEDGLSELYQLPSDPSQERNVISDQTAVARDVHRRLVGFMRETAVPEPQLKPRLELRIQVRAMNADAAGWPSRITGRTGRCGPPAVHLGGMR